MKTLLTVLKWVTVVPKLIELLVETIKTIYILITETKEKRSKMWTKEKKNG